MYSYVPQCASRLGAPPDEVIRRESTLLAMSFIREAEAKAAIVFNLCMRAFYTWNLTLSRWRSAESDSIVAAVHGAHAERTRVSVMWSRWRERTLLGVAVERWVDHASALAAHERRRVAAVRCHLERSILRVRALLLQWCAESVRCITRRRLLMAPLRRWVRTVAAQHLATTVRWKSRRMGSVHARQRSLVRGLRAWLMEAERACARMSATLRGNILSLECALTRWRTWAIAVNKWRHWATSLRRSTEIAEADDEGVGKIRRWRRDAALRWDVASSGFQAELGLEADKLVSAPAGFHVDWRTGMSELHEVRAELGVLHATVRRNEGSLGREAAHTASPPLPHAHVTQGRTEGARRQLAWTKGLGSMTETLAPAASQHEERLLHILEALD